MDNAPILKTLLKESDGLSLLETLIAIIILAVALASVSYFFSQARGNIDATGRMRCGLALAQDKMEELKDLGYSHLDLSEGPHSDWVDSCGIAKAEGEGEFYRQWTVIDFDDPADGISTDDRDYKLVVLNVYNQRLAPGSDPADPNKLVAELRTFISP